MQQGRVIQSVVAGRRRELFALRDFGIGVRFDEIQRAVGSETNVDARVAVEPQCPLDALRQPLNAGTRVRRQVLRRPIFDSHALLIIGIVLDLLGGDRLAAHERGLYKNKLQVGVDEDILSATAS